MICVRCLLFDEESSQHNGTLSRTMIRLLLLLTTPMAAAWLPASPILRSSRLFSKTEEVDVIVVGAGIGGLSCAALSAQYGFRTLCLEAHDTAGGVAHSFQRSSSAGTFHFDAGPSLIAGLSSHGSTNPLRQVLEAIGTADSIDWKTYDGWQIHDTSDGTSFRVTTGAEGTFAEALATKGGTSTKEAFEAFRDVILQPGGLAEASAYIPPLALRGGVGAVASLARYTFKLLKVGPKGNYLTGPFTKVMEEYGCTDPFLCKWFDYLAFALSGEDAAHTQAAYVVDGDSMMRLDSSLTFVTVRLST